MRILFVVFVLIFTTCKGQSFRNRLQNATHIFLEGLKDIRKDLSHGNILAAIKDLRGTIQHSQEGLLIVPGTKWCGPGSTAENYEDLGEEVEVDMCCREHDNCNDNIQAFGEKHGLTNKYSYTASNCDCDRKFYKCNKEAKTTTASSVGFSYFNILRPKCFIFDYPIIECIEFGKSRNKEHDCQTYKQDNSKPKIWQFMDAWDWNSKSEEDTNAIN